MTSNIVLLTNLGKIRSSMLTTHEQIKNTFFIFSGERITESLVLYHRQAGHRIL